MVKDTFCSYCGQRFPDELPFPRRCAGCSQTTWRNPIPVVVLLVPVGDGLLTVKRSIEPHVGKLALPGGYATAGETWQAAGVRELKEETGLTIDPAGVQLFALHSTPDGNALLVFGATEERLPRIALWSFQPTDETAELTVLFQPQELAFPLHTQVAGEWFARRGS